MSSHRISPETRTRILRLWTTDGVRSLREIGRLAGGVHRLTIRNVLRAEGLIAAGEEEGAKRGSPPPATPLPAPPTLPSPPDLASIVAEVLRQLGAGGAVPAHALARPCKPISVAPAPTGYTTEQKGNVSVVRIEYDGTFEQRFLLTADQHWDNPHSDREMQKRHLDKAIRVGAGIISCGDLFCAMQGKFDKRADKSSIRPEHQNGDYIDALVDTAIEWFAPYAKSFIRIAPGNHEAAIHKRLESDLITRLVNGLNSLTGSQVHRGGYSGWVHFLLVDSSGKTEHKKLYYTHGSGGGGPVTKGTIQTNRRAVYTPDADIVVSGHIHEEWELTIPRVRVDEQSRHYFDEQIHIQLPTYKEEYGDGYGGYHIENSRPPKPLGAAWLTFRKESPDEPIEVFRSRAK